MGKTPMLEVAGEPGEDAEPEPDGTFGSRVEGRAGPEPMRLLELGMLGVLPGPVPEGAPGAPV